MELIDFEYIARPDGAREPDTVLQMVQKLEALSTALTNFGGVPSVLKSPKAETLARQAGKLHPTPTKYSSLARCDDLEMLAIDTDTDAEKSKGPAVPEEQNEDNPLDNFLGMFDDEDEAPKQDTKQDAQKKLDYRLPEPREFDGPLTYGIQFIQNALKSWAQQRLQHQFAAQLQQQVRILSASYIWGCSQEWTM